MVAIRETRGAIAAILLFAASGNAAVAQAPVSNIEGTTGRGHGSVELPEYLQENESALETPRSNSSSPSAPTSASNAVFVRQFTFEDNSSISSETLSKRIEQYTGKYITTVELIEARDKITELYVERGFINSGAVIPDQQIRDGTVHILIVEGKLNEIRVQGIKSLSRNYVLSRFPSLPAQPLNIDELRRRYQLLLSDPAIETLNARLLPGPTLGTSFLDLAVTEPQRFFANLTVSNSRSPSIGENRLSLSGGARNILISGGLITGDIGVTQGSVDGRFDYRVPLTPSNLKLLLSAEWSDAELVEEPLSDLDIETKSEYYSGGLSYPVIHRLGNTLTLSGEYTHRASETSLLGLPFSFSPGADQGRTETTAVRLGQDWVLQDVKTVIALRSIISIGLDGTRSSTVTALAPSENFVTWLGQAQLATRVGNGGGQFIARASGQWSEDSLYASEKFTLGGLNSIRGYRRNQTLGDSGVTASIEYRQPIFDFSFGEATRDVDKNVSAALFLDAGRAWNSVGPAPANDSLLSAGVGVGWTPTKRVSIEAIWASQLRSANNPTSDNLQDDGLHFRITTKLY